MPGKVNPVMAEMINMVCYQVFGHDVTIQQAVAAAQLELNVMMPVVAYNFLQEIQILSAGLRAFTKHALEGLEADAKRVTGFVEWSTAIATALNPYIGYDNAAKVAKAAYAEGKTVRQIVKERNLLDENTLDEALNLAHMTRIDSPAQ